MMMKVKGALWWHRVCLCLWLCLWLCLFSLVAAAGATENRVVKDARHEDGGADHDDGLKDHPVVGSATYSLDGTWTATADTHTQSIQIGAKVPGDLITDLERAGVVGNPLYEVNFLNSSIWHAYNWTYTRNISLPSLNKGEQYLLVFDGVKMGATAYVNGHRAVVMTDQFLRYTTDISQWVVADANAISVTFDPAMDVNGRFMACTGGWDWAFYTNTENYGASTFAKGIWKSVYIVKAAPVAVAHVVPHVFYNGSYPNKPLQDDNHGDFEVHVKVFFQTRTQQHVTISVAGEWGSTAAVTIPAASGENEHTLKLRATAADIDLWWPAGMGAHPLYTVTASVAAAGARISTQRKVGFRVFALVTGNDTNPEYVNKNLHADGTDTQGMLFRVNGAAVYSRGANMIPMEELEGRLNGTAHRRLVQSAVEGGMNTLRVWGGGIFLPDAWYNACDEMGVLVYHDMQYAQRNHSPTNSSIQAAELRHQIRRLSHHPSIVMWDGCNECHVVIHTPTGIYATFVMAIVAQEDKSRVVWPSCPAPGWTNGVNRLTALPNGSPFGLLPRATPPHTSSRSPPVVAPAAAGEGGGGGSCKYQANTDYEAGTIWLHPTASSKEACCEECTRNSSCYLAVFYQHQCWFKHNASLPSFRLGRYACWPKGSGPVPPTPTPQPAPPAPGPIETHGPYQHGSGFPAMNGNPELQPFDPNIPISLTPYRTGPQYKSTYASEFGCVVMSSFESMAPTLAKDHWSLHGGAPPDKCSGGFSPHCSGDNVMAQRNYPCDSIVLMYFGQQDLNATGEHAFKKQLYMCMIGQALNMKSNIETRRGSNEFGTLIWQLNEIWPTGGWGSLEYGAPGQPGQVIGGRWKPLHYWLRASVYADTTAACDGAGLCYVKNDAIRSFTGVVTITAVHFDGSKQAVLKALDVALAAGAGVTQWFTVDLTSINFNRTVLVIDVTSHTVSPPALVSSNVQALTPPKHMHLQNANVTFSVASSASSDGTIDVSVRTDAPAMYVTLTTLAQGRFSDNAFLLTNEKVVQFIPFAGTTTRAAGLKRSLRLEHLAQYM